MNFTRQNVLEFASKELTSQGFRETIEWQDQYSELVVYCGQEWCIAFTSIAGEGGNVRVRPAGAEIDPLSILKNEAGWRLISELIPGFWEGYLHEIRSRTREYSIREDIEHYYKYVGKHVAKLAFLSG